MNRPVHESLPPSWPALFAPAATRIIRQTRQRHVCIFRETSIFLSRRTASPASSSKDSVASVSSTAANPSICRLSGASEARSQAASRIAAAGLAALLALTPAAQVYAQMVPLQHQQESHRSQAVAEAARGWEDALNSAARRLDVVAEQAFSSVGNAARSIPAAFGLASSEPDSPTASGAVQARSESAEARELVLEVGDLVADHFLDARNGGFSVQRWRSMVKDVLQGQLPDTQAAYRAIRQLLVDGIGDPYTRFVTPQQFEAMGVYDVTGVGMNLGSTDEYSRKVGFDRPVEGLPPQAIWVLATVKGSAAERAGVKQGDELVAINGDSIAGQSAYQTAALIQSRSQPPDKIGGTATMRISLRVRRANGSESDVAVTRAVQPYRSPVTQQIVSERDGPVGVIKLSAFNARTRAEIADALRSLEAEGATRYVLDLRNNLGGLFLEGVEVARLFLDGSTTLAVLEGQGRKAPEYLSAGGHAITQAPLTVLINERSASASEILAGALHDNCRAVLAGSRTYGKGLIQSVYQLDDGSALVLTVGKYLTPARTDIDRQGIVPDFSKLPSAADAQAALAACRVPTAAA